jgi:L-ribulose-5-phosphate 4-epimerase
MLEELKEQVCRANRELEGCRLVTLTFGNVSGFDRAKGMMAIKPSGVGYAQLRTGDIVLVDLDGKRAEGRLQPSTDAPTHLELYRAFPGIGGVTHTHSPFATMFAQARRAIPCLGTTHADHFNGEVPVTRPLTRPEVTRAYEVNTGLAIVERFRKLDPNEMPAVLVAYHGPFTWGRTPAESLTNSVALELVAQMAIGTFQLSAAVRPIPKFLLAKHFLRKHGPGAYYGQNNPL